MTACAGMDLNGLVCGPGIALPQPISGPHVQLAARCRKMAVRIVGEAIVGANLVAAGDHALQSLAPGEATRLGWRPLEGRGRAM